MSAYSAVISKSNLAVAKTEGPSVYGFNFILLTLMVISTIAYIFLANLQVTWEYSLNSRKNKQNVLNAQTISRNQGFAEPSLEAVLLFAQKSGMVEAKETDSILQDRNFALTP